jgi:enoyl-CoA hydratase
MSELRIERPEAGVALVRLTRPEAKNALNMALRRALHDAFLALSEDADIRVVVLTGDREAFAAGADLTEIAELGPIDVLRRATHRLSRPLAECPKPVIAAINGYALGGGLEIALMCDILVVGEGAQLGLPEIRVGVMPGAGGTQRLTKLVGKHRAMLMALTAEIVTGRQAYELGLASKVVADDAVLDEALAIAKRIAGFPPIGAAMIKESIQAAAEQGMESNLALERKSFALLFATQDQKEGAKAFLEKRKPKFQGR